jgi:WhiB family transcriptional regulator, redox-sensing transcriptional regulator
MPWFLKILIPVRPAAERDWWLRAACRFIEPDLFFPISNSGASRDQATTAKAVCAACEVRSECLAFAGRTRQNHGIRGGLTEDERAAIVRRAGGPPAEADSGEWLSINQIH